VLVYKIGFIFLTWLEPDIPFPIILESVFTLNLVFLKRNPS